MNIDEQKSFKKLPESYWIASTDVANYPALNEDINIDIAIVGGGMTGITCAYLLSNNGLNIALFEADQILHKTTGYTTAKITSQHGLIYHKIKNQISEELARQYAVANESAIKFIEELTRTHHIDCDFTTQAAYVYTQQDAYLQKISDEVQTASSLGIKATYTEEIPFDVPIKAAVRFDHQAQFHPRKYLLALANEITDRGLPIYEHSRIVAIEEVYNSYVLTTEQGKKVTAGKVIIASHYPFYNKHGMYFGRIYSERSYVVAVKAKEKYPGGMYITAEEPTRSLRQIDTIDGELILIGGDHHKTGQGKDTIKHYEALIDFSNEIFTVEDVPYRWSTQDCMTLDDIPYVGRFTSKTPDLYIATGYGKWGMTNSTAAAMLIKDLIIDGKSPWEDVYNPSRQAIMASAKKFVVENANVAKELIEGKLSTNPAEINIKRGEGRVINVNGQRTGAYRDDQGKLHLVNTTCTHMGCELNWNSAERTWDCPCHGSRFSYEGEIIEGPAVKPLDRNIDVNTINKLIHDDF